jgi:maleylpyruvate isomerase
MNLGGVGRPIVRPMNAPQHPDLPTTLSGCRAAHIRLGATLEHLDGAAASVPSRLPEWTLGHILAHLARNAESHIRMLEGAMRGEHLEQYAGGHEQRAADIERGASRPTSELVEDVARTAALLERTWSAMTVEAWDGYGLSLGRQWPCRELPLHRWREVEVHHADLGLGYDVSDWPDDYVAIELPRALTLLPERIHRGSSRRQLLAWLFGRAGDPGQIPLQPWRGGPGT